MHRLALLLFPLLVAACQPGAGPSDANDGAAVAAPASSATPARASPPVPASTATTAAVADATPDAVDPAQSQVVVHGDHIVVEDSAHAWPLYFEQADHASVARAMAAFGPPRERAGPDDCSAGPLVLADYPNGLQLSFQDGRLAGYWVRENARGVATARDVQPGSPRAVLGGAELVEASFGALADLDGVIAVLDEGQRKVTALYAGAVCIYD